MRHLALLAPTVALAACVTHGNQFDPANIDRLQPGVSTKADAIAALGKPVSESNMADGSTLLQWQFVKAVYLSATAAHAAILFDRAGVMVRVTHRYEGK